MDAILLSCISFILFQACHAQTPTPCDPTHILSCWKPIDLFLTSIGEQSSKDHVVTANLTDAQLDEFCLLWKQSTSGCLVGLRDQCSDSRKQEFFGQEDALDFMCSSLTRYKLFKECVSNRTVVYRLKSCDLQFSNDLKLANSNNAGTDAKNRAICNAAHKEVKCKTDVVKRSCGIDASTWIEEYEDKKDSPYLDGTHGCSNKGFCSNQNIETCWFPVNSYLKSINKGDIKTLDFMFHTLDKSQIAQFCVIYEISVSSCLSTLNQTCDLHTRMLFEGQEYQLDFLCQQGLEEFLLHKDCYTNPSVTSGMKECTGKLDRQLQAANRQPSPSRVDQAYCTAIKSAMECDKKVVSTSCNTNSGDWIEEYKLRKYKPLLEQLNCEELSLHCTQTNVDRCWLPTEVYKKSIGFTDASQGFALFHLSDDQLRNYCRIYIAKVSDCLAKIRPFCDQTTRKRFEGLEDSLDFLCKDTLDEYIKHKSCIGSAAVQRSLQDCNVQFNKDINNIVKKGQKPLKKSDQEQMYCDAVQDDLNCDKSAVGDKCGKDAAVWTYEYQMKYLEPYLDHIGCEVGGVSSGIKALIALLVLGTIALVAGLSIFAWNFYTKKKAQKSQTEHVRFDNPLSSPDIPPNNMSSYSQAGEMANGYGYDNNVKVEKIDTTYMEIEDNNLQVANPTVNPVGVDTGMANGDLSDGYQPHDYINTEEVQPQV